MIWLMSTIDRKFNLIIEKSFDIAHISEYILQILYNRILMALAKDRISNPKVFINQFNKIISPDEEWKLVSADHYFRLREYC